MNSLLKSRRHWMFGHLWPQSLAARFLLVPSVILLTGCHHPSPPGTAVTDPPTVYQFGPYRVTETLPTEAHEGAVRVECNGRLLDKFGSERFEAVGFCTNRAAEEVQCVLADLNGDGQPELVLQTWPEGGRWLSLRIYTATGCAVALPKAGEGVPLLEDLGHDGRYELRTTDSAYYGWLGGGAGSLCPTVILAWQEGRLQPSARLMRLPPPTAAQLRVQMSGIREMSADTPEEETLEIFRAAVDWMYGGQEPAGWELLRLARASGTRVEDQQIKEFNDVRRQSVWWPKLTGQKSKRR